MYTVPTTTKLIRSRISLLVNARITMLIVIHSRTAPTVCYNTTHHMAKKGFSLKRFFFFALAPIYVPMALFLNLTFEWWQDLNDDK